MFLHITVTRKLKLYLVLMFSLLGICFLLVNCSSLSTGENDENTIAPEYTQQEDLISSRECGQCHTEIFKMIKTDGGKHRINCRRCHEQFHTYQPGKMDFQDALPECATCHSLPHGEALDKCTECHQQVHTPKTFGLSTTLTINCDKCHQEIDKQIKTFATQHSNFYCSICHHTKHGYKPECAECHQPHLEEMTQADCVTCHPPHKALEVVYPAETANEVCAACHRLAYETLNNSRRKHAAFNCTKCHPDKHQTIMQCTDCHQQPHDKAIHENIQICGQCHGIAHSLVL